MKQNAYNIVGLGVTLSAGKWYKVVWFYEGGAGAGGSLLLP